MINIISLLNMSTKEVFNYLLNKFPNAITDGENYIYETHNYKHNTLLVSHIDTIDDSTVKRFMQKKIVKQDKTITNIGSGVLGADDRAGVWAILNIIETRKYQNKSLPPVLFTNYEESGGIGVREFCQYNKLDKEQIHLMVEIDREGNEQYVQYHENDKQVDEYVESFGFKEHFGIYSDISDLTEEFEIPSINVSAGYVHQHTNREYLRVDWLKNSIKKVKKMLDNPIDKCYDVALQQGYAKYFDDNYWGRDFLYEQEDTQPKYIVVDTIATEALIDNITTEFSNCKMCQKRWWDCDCGKVISDIAMHMSAPQIDYLLEQYVFEKDFLHSQLVGLRKYFYEIQD